MAEESERGQAGSRRKGKEGTQSPSSDLGLTPPSVPAPEIPTEIRDELADTMGGILLKAQECALEMATLDCNTAKNCSLFTKSRELIEELKKLLNIQRRLAKRPRAGVA